MRPRAGDWRILGDAIGRSADAVVLALGEPVARSHKGFDLWLAFEAPGRSLLVRCDASGADPRVASWTLSFDAGPATLREAAEPLGLWPACAPDVAAPRERRPMIRRVVPDRATGDLYSLTASLGGGRVRKITLFDERPEWI